MAQKLDHESFASLDPRHPLTQSDVNERELPKEIGKLWMEVARRLSFQQTEIDAIKMENPSDKERCIDLLVRWMNKEGREGATAGKLADALTKAGLKTLAEKLLGPLNGRRRIVIEVTGTIKLHDNKEVMFGVDCFGKTVFFIWKTEEKEFKTSPEELKNFVDASFQIAEMVSSAENADNSFFEEEKRIYSQLENLQGKLMDIAKSLEISELKEDTFPRTSKLDFIDKHSRTLQELYSEVTRMTREACICNHILRRKFYNFTNYSLRSVHNDLSARLEDLESEKERMTKEDRKNLENLILYRNGRKRLIRQLEKLWKRLFSQVLVNELEKSVSFPSENVTQTSLQKPRSNSEGARPKGFKTKSRIPRIKTKKTQDKESCVLKSYKTDNDRNQDKDTRDEV